MKTSGFSWTLLDLSNYSLRNPAMKLVAMMTSATFPFTLIFVSIGILTGEFNDLVEILYSQLIEVQYLYVLSFS